MGISKRAKTKWYLEDVNPKKNFVWTEKKRKRVFTLRKKLPAREVARKMNLTVIQVYNATRMVRRGLSDECFVCGNKLTEKEKIANEKKIKSCFKCKKKAKEYKNKRRRIAIKNKMCVYCEKRPAREGHVSCTKCISATHRRRYRQNLCGQCGKNSINYPEESVCPSCAKKNRIRSAEYEKRKKKQNKSIKKVTNA